MHQGCQKAKINYLIGQLQYEEFVSFETRGKYVLSEKEIMFIETMSGTDARLDKSKDDKKQCLRKIMDH